MKKIFPLRPAHASPTAGTHPSCRISSPIKGRGTPQAYPHRFQAEQREEWNDGWEFANPNPASDQTPIDTTITKEYAKQILVKNDSPDIPFMWSLNPYRGCEHGCIYCYARPTHSYLNLSPGIDFETRLIVKINAAELLTQALSQPTHIVSPIAIGSATDAYQPIERQLHITRAVLEVLIATQHPFTILTKSSGIERDLDLIAEASLRQQAFVGISLTTLDKELARILEPRAAAPYRRLQTIERLSRAGIPVRVFVAPIIPFLNEPEIEHIAEAAAQAGACALNWSIIRLPWEVNPLFQEWLQQHFPLRAQRVMARIREIRGDKDYQADFKQRMPGPPGVWADLIKQRVNKAAQRVGLTERDLALDCSQFRPMRPNNSTQLTLF